MQNFDHLLDHHLSPLRTFPNSPPEFQADNLLFFLLRNHLIVSAGKEKGRSHATVAGNKVMELL
jgi:hypothetical protein